MKELHQEVEFRFFKQQDPSGGAEKFTGDPECYWETFCLLLHSDINILSIKAFLCSFEVSDLCLLLMTSQWNMDWPFKVWRTSWSVLFWRVRWLTSCLVFPVCVSGFRKRFPDWSVRRSEGTGGRRSDSGSPDGRGRGVGGNKMKEEEEDQVGAALNVFVRLLNLFYFFSFQNFLFCASENRSVALMMMMMIISVFFLWTNQSLRNILKLVGPASFHSAYHRRLAAAGWGGAAVRKRRGLH